MPPYLILNICGGIDAKFQVSRTTNKKPPHTFNPKLRLGTFATVCTLVTVGYIGTVIGYHLFHRNGKWPLSPHTSILQSLSPGHADWLGTKISCRLLSKERITDDKMRLGSHSMALCCLLLIIGRIKLTSIMFLVVLLYFHW